MNTSGLIESLVFLIPFGFIGLYRWCSWLLKVYLSSRYHQPQGDGSTLDWNIAAALTLKGESQPSFERLLNALIRERINQVYIVFDAAEAENIALFERFAQEHREEIVARYVVTTEKGKRRGLKKAILMVENADVILAMDSDTYLGTNFRKPVLDCFTDPQIGGVAIKQRIWEPRVIIDHLFDLTLYMRFEQDIKGQALGKRVSVLSGRCSAYRAEVLQDIVRGLDGESWLGIKKTGGGEDKYLTTALYDAGYKTSMALDTMVWTRPEGNFRVHSNQRLRWARNSWFSDFRALLTRSWMWLSPILWFYTTDRMISAFTLMLAPWYMVYALVNGQVLAFWILVVWWMASRFVKAYGYFRETGRYWLLPIYVLSTYYFGMTKIHALVTIGETSWMTRGAGGQRLFSRFTWLVTILLIATLGIVVFGPLTP
jgi:cellulose synthase/poly-beta-1,6-N-acetylglucosamine synthase-like glycosyltransferase